jgi:hypothetical protein
MLFLNFDWGGRVIHHCGPPVRRPFDARDAGAYAVTRMPSFARTERTLARSALSGRPVGLHPLDLDLLGLLILAR